MEIKVRIKHYNGIEERAQALKVAHELGLSVFSALSLKRDVERPPEGWYVLDLSHVFENQYNTDQYRIFEFHDPLIIGAGGRTQPTCHGYYIAEGIEEIRAYQKKLNVCSYCGAQYFDSKETVCKKCAGSEYLTEKDYPLLNLRNIREKKFPTAKLSPEMLAFIQAEQRKTRTANLKKQQADKLARLKNEIADAETEYKAFKWLIENNLDFENVIFYPHTGRFSFGWREKLTKEEAATLTAKLQHFPFSYEIQEEK